MSLNLNEKSTDDLNDTVLKVASAGLSIEKHCNAILRQPAFTALAAIKGMEDINKHLTTTQNNATHYLNEVQPLIIDKITAAGTYAVEFPVFVTEAKRFMDRWEGGDASAQASLIGVLDIAKGNVGEIKESAVEVKTKINESKQLFIVDHTNFSNLVTASQSSTGELQKRLEQIDAEVDSLNARIAAASVGVGLSSLAIIGGSIMIGIGALATFPSAGASTALIAVGGVLVGAGGGGLVPSSIYLAQHIAERATLRAEKVNLNKETGLLSAFKDTSDLLQTHMVGISENLGNMHKSWSIIDNELGAVLQNITNARSVADLSPEIALYLNHATANWGRVDTSIENIKAQMAGVQVIEMRDSSGNLVPISLYNINEYLKIAA